MLLLVQGEMDCHKDILSHDLFQGSPGFVILGLKQKENVIEAGLQKQVKIIFIEQSKAVCEQPADLTVLLCVSNQILADRRAMWPRRL